MDQPITPRIADQPANQPPQMVKQNPPSFQQSPQGGPQRFPVNNNGPGQPPPPLRHLDSRSSLLPGQFPQSRPPPPYGPRPRNVFYPRSPGSQPPPPISGSPIPPGAPGQYPNPQLSVPGSPIQAVPQQTFPGPRFIQNPNIRGPLPPPQRPPFSGNPQQFFPRNSSDQLRGPADFVQSQKLQRNDSVANLNPRFPIVPVDRRPQLIPQISVERMSDDGTKVTMSGDGDIKKLAKENDDDDDVVVDSEKLSAKIDTPRSPRLSISSRQNSGSIDGERMQISGLNSPARIQSAGSHQSPGQQSPGSHQSPASHQSPVSHQSPIQQQSPASHQSLIQQQSPVSHQSPAHQQSSIPISAPVSRPPSAALSPNKMSRPPSAIKETTDNLISPENKSDEQLSSKSPDISDTNAENPQDGETVEVVQGKISIPNTPKLPKTPDSVQGFDNGMRRSLTSRSSSESKSPKSPRSPGFKAFDEEEEKKRTTFADMDENGDIGSDDSRSKSGYTTPTTPRKRISSGSRSPSKENRRSLSARGLRTDAENDSGVDESTQRGEAPTLNGIRSSPTKRTSSKSREADKSSMAGSPVKSPSKSAKSLLRTPDTASSASIQDKKLPMNKVQVGAAPSPNLKTVKSKIGSLANTAYKPGGGKIKIENRKLDFSKAQPKIAAKNDKYAPSGGDKKIQQVKLQWNAKSKIGSLENTTHKPGGGDKKIETVKLDFKDKAKPKVGSKDNTKHVPGGGTVKIETQKVDIKAESKIGSLDNVKHKPGGGDKKIFNDKDYLRQTSSNAESLSGSGSQSPIPSGAINNDKNGLPQSDENLNQEC
ncbi:microtubule-associated protein tau-like isoform X2 [Leptopilina heterotoma]|uniref:microtubule-associated protein tau-like isoform X2 n=1 Tax=Leptopilina heterotoma TaxID=63436 RepID=UPI001CA9865E|nr:microtubule-associated protein tau-like isoform X2 [Leptopilina heterotoma]